MIPRGELLRALSLCAACAPSLLVSRQLICDGHSKTNSWFYLVTGSVFNRKPYVRTGLQKKVNVYVQNNIKIEPKRWESGGQNEQKETLRKDNIN